MTTVTIYHNGQHECLECRQPVIRLGRDEWAHLREGADHVPARVIDSGDGGYRPGHAMVPVFRAEVPDGASPDDVAQRMYVASNGDPEILDNPVDWGLAVAYRERGLRPLGASDVIDVGGTLLAVAVLGWFEPVTGKIRVSWVGCPGTVPLPHCSYCHVIADPADLEPVNSAGDLACRVAVECADRVNARA